jgi:ABC-2 type transport system permease protein
MIRDALVLAKKELYSILVSPVSYAMAGVFFFVNWILLYLYVQELRGDFETISTLFFTWFGFWFLAIFIPPILTMRLLSDEFRLGTIEMLMTAPSSDAGVVLGKYLAALGFCVLLWLPTLALFIVAQAYGAGFDWGVIASGYLGAILVYGLFCAVGLFASTLSESPLLSMLLAIVLELVLFFSMLLPAFLPTSEFARTVADRYSIYNILVQSLTKGIVSTTHLTYVVSFIWILLFAATRSLEVRRWR